MVFFSNKEKIFAIIKEFKYSTRREKIDMRRYVKEFYELLLHMDLTTVGLKNGNEIKKLGK